jgi:hypothetical protein
MRFRATGGNNARLKGHVRLARLAYNRMGRSQRCSSTAFEMAALCPQA